MTEAHRDIVAFYSNDWDGEVDVANCEITKDGTKGFCILMNGSYVVHPGSPLLFAWMEYGDHPVRMSPVDNAIMIN